MDLIRKLLFTYLVVLSITSARGQSCLDFHTRTCPIPDFSYYYDQQSASFSMKVADTTELRAIVFEKSDYYVSVCAHKKIKRINLNIYEDTPQRKLLYSNSTNAYSDSVKFSNDLTQQVIFEVSIPVQGNDKDDKRERCVGVLIAKRIRVEALKID